MVIGRVARRPFSASRRNLAARTPGALAPAGALMPPTEWIAAGAESLSAIQLRAPGFGLVRVVGVVNGERGAPRHAPSWIPRLLPAGVHYEGHPRAAGGRAAARAAGAGDRPTTVISDRRRAAKASRQERLLRMRWLRIRAMPIFITSSAKDLRSHASAEALPTILKRIAGEAAAPGATIWWCG